MNLKSLSYISTLLDILSYRAVEQPNQTAFTFLADGETESSSVTYQELDRQARGIALQLQSLGVRGERALLLYPPGLEFITAFLGCLYAGVIAVPAYPPKRNQNLLRLQTIIADSQAKLALTTISELANIKSRLAQNSELTALQWLATDDIITNLASHWQPLALDRHSLAYLQYTSGSTSTPKGVMVTHHNLLHNSEYIKQAFELTPDSVSVTWLPSFHDMGLIDGILQPLYTGFPAFIMPPASFVQRPIRWLEAISRYQATHCGGPNFAYQLCTLKVTPEEQQHLNLNSWCSAYSGAEPIRRETLELFSDTFKSCGFRASFFYPCYGMAEATLMISGGNLNQEPIYCTVAAEALAENQVLEASEDTQDVRHIVGCGHSWLDTKIIIADPKLLIKSSPNQVGEIWVSSGSVASGYWNRPEDTEKTFHAYLKNTGEGPFLRTGDLGFLQNGELFVTGRLKDMIIVQGRNHYPQDIEYSVEQCHPALRPNSGAAFSVEIGNEERLVVVQEVERSYLRKLNANGVIAAIRQAIAEQHDLQVYAVLLLKTMSLPKTSSGKIQRSACRAEFVSKTLDVVESWIAYNQNPTQSKHQAEFSGDNQEAIKVWLIAKISELLQIPPQEVNVRQPLAQYGLSSVAFVGISGELQQWLGCQLSPTLLYDYPTIESLAQYLGEGGQETYKAFISRSQSPVTNEAIGNACAPSIAIIGMGCRFPEAKNPEAFWQLLRSGVDAIKEVPKHRWSINSDKTEIRWGGFLEQVDLFDPKFFGISPREAELMDPQQRLLLEVSWEALENAGQTREQLTGTQTGVFIGISNYDYSRLQFNNPVATNAYSGTGNAFSIAANRLSYLLDLRGPSWAVDTACSSSLVAVHQACQNLRLGECNLAIAGGVNLILSPELSVIFSNAGMISSDGRCKTFDAQADGYVRGEGCGVVILKRLADALQDKDNILAIIRGSAVNQDGLSNGLTAPNGTAQQAVICQALKNALVLPEQISYVEAHGTGTSLGDPIELNSLKAVLMEGRQPNQPCWIGSVKTNIGHLEAAAGIAGLIKLVLSLQHKEIVPHLHLQQLNPYISLQGTPITIATQPLPWSAETEPRLAGVSSFGFGGTNCHIILEEAPSWDDTGTERHRDAGNVLEEVSVSPLPNFSAFSSRPVHLLALSAQTETALKQLAERYERHLATNSAVNIVDVCFTAHTGRLHFENRLAVVAESTAQLQKKLSCFTRGEETTGLVLGQTNSQRHPKLAFFFTGQGSQYLNMGRQLYETQPTFRAAINRCDEILHSCLDTSLISILYPNAQSLESKINETAYTQPALFALEYALFKLWQSWGVEPTVVIGHSLGEYVAATVAGVFSLEDGLKLVAKRARLMQSLPQTGEMVAVFADESQVVATIQPYSQNVAIAAINGSNNIVISGERESITKITTDLAAQGFKTQKLNVSHAFHSPLMESILGAFESKAREVKFFAPQLKLISNVTGEIATEEIATVEYWCRHLRHTVQFGTSIETLCQQGIDVCVEIGPKPILLAMARNCLSAREEGSTAMQWVPSLRPGLSDWETILQSLGMLYASGVKIDWLGFDRDYPRRRVQLPTYPFQQQRYWFKESQNKYKEKQFLSSPILNLFHQGETEQIIQQLETVKNLSEDEIKLIPKVVDTLVRKHQQQFQVAAIQDWFYQIEWQSQPLKTSQQKTASPGSWLILADRGGVGQSLAKHLETQGHNCFLVYAEQTSLTKTDKSWSLNPSQPIEFERLLQEVLTTSKLPLQGVVHLWSLETTLLDELTDSTFEQTQIWGCGSLLSLVQALMKYEHLGLPRLWVVTRGVQPTERCPMSLHGLMQASVWGLGKVVALEHPQLWGGLLDLAPEPTENEAAIALAQIQDSLGEDLFALRAGQCYVARLTKIHPPESPTVQIKPDVSYLITGGLGALGIEVAQWFAARGAKFIVLLGRTQASPHASRAIAKLEGRGIKVLVAQADVSQSRDMLKVFKEVEDLMPPLRGIIHAAGVLDDGILLQQNWERFTQVMNPKVKGAWNLHKLTEHLPLDFFVVFSSVAALLGSPGQGNYAAANAFVDNLIHHRLALGLPGLSINWGPWNNIGMTTGLGSHQQSRFHQGLNTIAPQQGLQALEQILGQISGQVGIIPFDWSAFNKIHHLPVLSGIVRKVELDSPSQAKQTEFLQQLEQTSANHRFDLLTAHIQSEVAKVLGLEPSVLPKSQQPLFSMGMDSLMVVELKNRLEVTLSCSIPATLALEFPTIENIAKYLVGMQRLAPLFSNKAKVTDNIMPLKNTQKDFVEILAKVEQLCEDKVEQSIVEEMIKLNALSRSTLKNIK